MGFWGSLTGSDQKKAIRRADAEATAQLDQGYAGAQPYYDKAEARYQPYAATGISANRLLRGALGLGTPEQRTAAEDVYFDDPGQQKVLEQKSNALLRQLNARGGTYGGRAALAGTRVGVENYNNWLDRLTGQQTMGLGTAGAVAGLDAGRGDMRYGLGVTKAGQAVNKGSALAQASTAGVNNLLSLGGLAVKGFGAFSDVRLKRDITHVGEMPSGLPIVEFSYVWGPERYRGVLAQDALEFVPEAVLLDDSGYLMVDYAAL